MFYDGKEREGSLLACSLLACRKNKLQKLKTQMIII